jgi:ATP-dependent Clp protease adapter protein ClpS
MAFTMNKSKLLDTTSALSMATATMPFKQKTPTDYKTHRTNKFDEDDEDDEHDDDNIRNNKDAPLEWLEDEWSTREPEDPYHILLLGSTFDKNKRVTVSYVSGCVTYVLGMPEKDAVELTTIASVNGMSCLGTWEREECLKLGRQLRIRDISVRVVPFCKGGSREWQAKDAGSSFGEKIPLDGVEIR